MPCLPRLPAFPFNRPSEQQYRVPSSDQLGMPRAYWGKGQADSEKSLCYPVPSIASADMDFNQLEAFLTAQTKKQGGITSDQAAVIAKFWKNHRIKIHESLINQSRWDNVLKNMNWRVDLKSQSRHIDQINTPVAIVEMELGKNGQESEFLCLEFDEAKVSQMLKKLSEIEESMTLLTQTT
ncbi:PREDICTED: COMM domain-containing protein 1 [Fulmarus glacialis]|uniref:COMM domain-containing protein 1 n=1 Tax=Fulmarus glacialis TaxID=30455 RepID=UPI00051BE7A4|nr:PREDICTED: COMM domain-containing protein 1 [Fulmarus glacialis]